MIKKIINRKVIVKNKYKVLLQEDKLKIKIKIKIILKIPNNLIVINH